MPTSPSALLRQYAYDALDRLIESSQPGQPGIQHFYNRSRLATQVQGAAQYCLFQSEHQLFAQHRLESGTSERTLLSHDPSRSVMQAIISDRSKTITYTAYGHTQKKCSPLTLLQFNGELIDNLTGHYPLGNGYRSFNPVLMRFNSPDSISPFGAGGLNCYAYCEGDPINFVDSTGHFANSLRQSLVSLFSSPLKKSQLSTSLDLTGGVTEGLGKYQNIKRITKGIYAADEPMHGGRKRLVISGHGREGGHLTSNNKIQDPREFVRKMEKKGIFATEYSDVHLLVCHSAEGGGNRSLAHYLNTNFKVPVTAYKGEMGTFHSPSQVVKNATKKIPWIYRSSFQVLEATFVKSKEVDIRTNGTYIASNGRKQKLNYQPVKFG
ncbi:hypothetical protein PS858_02703 [Pseudomonas fluorescens]|nr:hypothetical protein PS858_02703 [Pseudomonas fluorescens]